MRPWSLPHSGERGRSPTCHARGKPLRLCNSGKCGRVKWAKCKLRPNFLGVWPLMNIISSTVPPAVHLASTPPSLPPGKRAQGEGRAPESSVKKSWKIPRRLEGTGTAGPTGEVKGGTCMHTE